MSKFLIDHNCNFLEGGEAARPRALDSQNVVRAYNDELTVVTNNANDYLWEFNKFQRKLQRNECHELVGLVIVPNKQFEAEPFWNSIKRGVVHAGRKVTWREVRDYNLVVGPPDEHGRARLRRFEQCFYCKKYGMRRPKWVEALPIARWRKPKKSLSKTRIR